MTTATQIERLKQAARVIRELPSEHTLNMEPWFCGTVACLAGWCAEDTWFNRQGFYNNTSGVPSYKAARGFRAIGAFFGNDAKPLFYSSCPSERSTVIVSLETFIVDHTPKPAPILPILLITYQPSAHRLAA